VVAVLQYPDLSPDLGRLAPSDRAKDVQEDILNHVLGFTVVTYDSKGDGEYQTVITVK